MDAQEKVRENWCRRKARRLGLVLRKSRARAWNLDNHMEYRIVDAWHNFVMAGERFDMDLAQVVDFLNDYEDGQRRGELASPEE